MRTKIKRTVAKTEKVVFTIDEARRYIGVSYTIMRRILDSGELTFRQVGRRVLITREALDRWLRFEPVGSVSK